MLVGPLMQYLVPLLLVIAITSASAQTELREPHLREGGTSVIFARSTFAHGYRHGYEEGYHMGNVDINMGRQARTKLSQFHDVPRGYSGELGPKKSFDAGFQEGLKAGYADGYAGRIFRAVDTLRLISQSLSQTPMAADPRNLYFDQGFASGYGDGLNHGQKEGNAAQRIDLRFVNCSPFHPAKEQDLPAQESFCEGYRRGYTLGHADGVILRPEHGSLEASR